VLASRPINAAQNVFAIDEYLFIIYCQSITGHLMFQHNFGKCELIYKFFNHVISRETCYVQ